MPDLPKALRHENLLAEPMLPIILRVKNAESGQVDEHFIRKTPFFIGRASSNDLCLRADFISSRHGELHFGDGEIRYFDPDSRNGALLDGKLMPKETMVRVPNGSTIRIGPFTLTFAPTSDLVENEADTSELDLSRVRARLDKLRPVYTAYKEASQTMLSELRAQLEGLGQEETAELLEFVVRTMPEVNKEEELMKIARDAGHPLEEESADNLRHLKAAAPRLIPWARPAKSNDDVEKMLQRAATTLRTFSDAFVELRSGLDKLGEETGIEIVRGYGLLCRTKEPAEVLEYLLDWSKPGPQRLEEMRSVLSDMNMHQLAFWEGISAGLKAVLKALSPKEIERELEAQKKLPLLGKAAACWERYREVHEFMQDQSMLASVLLGPDFVRAYGNSRRQGARGGTMAMIEDHEATPAQPAVQMPVVTPLFPRDEGTESVPENAVIASRSVIEVEEEDPHLVPPPRGGRRKR